MQRSPCKPDTVGGGLVLPNRPPWPKLQDQLRPASYSCDGIRTIQEPLDRREVNTTTIYTHVLNRGGTACEAESTSCRGFIQSV